MIQLIAINCNARTMEESNEIYEAGTQFLSCHLKLTKLSCRLLDLTYPCDVGSAAIELALSLIYPMRPACRLGIVAWILKPKFHAPRLYTLIFRFLVHPG